MGHDEIVVASYDVLVINKETVDKDNSGAVKVSLSLFQPQKTHVGNNRYQVFINMHKSEFEQAKHDNEDVSPIVNRVVDIVTTQCEPKGRFLLKEDLAGAEAGEGPDRWCLMSQEQLQVFVASSLATPSRRHSKMLALTQSITSPKFDLGDLALDDDDEDDDSKKRGRRPSLLRRSVSDSNMPADDSKKKTIRTDRNQGSTTPDHRQRRRGSAGGMRRWKSALNISTNRRFSGLEVIQSEEFLKEEESSELSLSGKEESSPKKMPAAKQKKREDKPTAASETSVESNPINTPSPTPSSAKQNETVSNAVSASDVAPLDVLFRSSGVLRAGHTGNNRIQVLMDIKRAGYAEADPQEKIRMVKDLLQVVTNHWKGRFLREDGKQFVLLHPSTVESLLRSCIETQYDDDVSVASMSVAGTSSVASMSVTSVRSEAKPSERKKEAFEAIHKLAPKHEDSEVGLMQKTAVASLQKKKKRQGLASRLRNLAARVTSVGSVDTSASVSSDVSGLTAPEAIGGNGRRPSYSMRSQSGDFSLGSQELSADFSLNRGSGNRGSVVMQKLAPGVMDQLVVVDQGNQGIRTQRPSVVLTQQDQLQQLAQDAVTTQNGRVQQQRPSLVMSQQEQNQLQQLVQEGNMQQRPSLVMSQQEQSQLQQLVQDGSMQQRQQRPSLVMSQQEQSQLQQLVQDGSMQQRPSLVMSQQEQSQLQQLVQAPVAAQQVQLQQRSSLVMSQQEQTHLQQLVQEPGTIQRGQLQQRPSLVMSQQEQNQLQQLVQDPAVTQNGQLQQRSSLVMSQQDQIQLQQMVQDSGVAQHSQLQQRPSVVVMSQQDLAQFQMSNSQQPIQQLSVSIGDQQLVQPVGQMQSVQVTGNIVVPQQMLQQPIMQQQVTVPMNMLQQQQRQQILQQAALQQHQQQQQQFVSQITLQQQPQFIQVVAAPHSSMPPPPNGSRSKRGSILEVVHENTER